MAPVWHWVIPVLAQIILRVVAQTDAGRQAENRAAGQNGGKHKHSSSVSGEQPVRNRENGIADDAAKAGRQRPAGGNRQQRGEPRRKEPPSDPQPQPGGYPFKTPRADEPPSPKADRRQKRDCRNAEHLHDKIGGNGPWRA